MQLDAYSIVLTLPVILIALTVHEYAHAFVADRLGDQTARRSGRLTLEPWAHLDPIGLLMVVFFRFGWAKPVPVNAHNMRDPAKGLALASLAGPVSNLLLALLFGLVLAAGGAGLAGAAAGVHLARLLSAGVYVNTGLAVFNLLPLPPLDGSRILAGLAPSHRWSWWPALEAYGPLLLLLLMASGLGARLISGPANAVSQLVYQWSFGLARLLRLG